MQSVETHIVDGRKFGDITCITRNRTSLIDYGTVSSSLFESVLDLVVESRGESDHLPETSRFQFESVDSAR